MLLIFSSNQLITNILNEISIKIENDQEMQRKKIEKLENNLLDRPSSILSIKQMAQLMKLCNFSLEQKWNLLYRASENGFLAEDFHRKYALIRHKIPKDPLNLR